MMGKKGKMICDVLPVQRFRFISFTGKENFVFRTGVSRNKLISQAYWTGITFESYKIRKF